MSWSDWAAGVLADIGAPIDATNADTLWAWSNAESGTDVMRWNNPLNTTYFLPGSTNMNSVGVKSYATEQDGVAATVATLNNGRYPVILDHMRRSIPRQQWQDACANLQTWGTGCAWISRYYGAAPGVLEVDMTPAQDQTLSAIYAIVAGSRIPSKAIDQAGHDIETEVQAVQAALKAVPAGGGLTADQATLLQRLEAKLDRIIAELHTP